mmetsp:Transcript_14014/g.17170  ORF Transcript_14014/g.17170 Transcript_14014/m.17170 type:complete len:255 (-) Transcript_14014:602-1366(-)
MTQISPTVAARNGLSSRSSGWPGLGVIKSPDSQQCPTTTTSSTSLPTSEVTPELGNMVMGWIAPYKEGRRTSVMPASSFKKVWLPSPVVKTLSCTVHTKAPALATRNVPGSISRVKSRPISCLNPSKACFTGPPMLCKSVVCSSGLRPTLYPPPRLQAVTLSQILQKLKLLLATLCQISGSDPEPMCVWMRSTTNPCLLTIASASPPVTSSCQIPKLEDGPPTLVLEKEVVDFENPPDPTPGFTRIPTFWDFPE